MKNFELQLATKIRFGEGVLDELGTEVAALGRTALLVYGQGSIKRSGLYDTVMDQLTGAGVTIIEHSGVKPNPVLSHAEEGMRLIRKNGVDVILAVGGGSVIDEAKGIAIGAANEPPLWDFYSRKRFATEALPVVAVQTLPATSSELNPVSVMTNEETKEKFGARSAAAAPRVSFLDPTLTTTIPIQYTAYACTDILSHMMEGYFNATAEWMPVQDGMVEGICKAVIASMDQLLVDPANLEARSTVMWAGALAWSGLLNAGVDGAVIPCHMLEHPMSAYHDVAHGAGLSVVIPAWLRYMRDRVSKRIVRFGRYVLEMGDQLEGLSEPKQADAVTDTLVAWYRKIGTPVTFAEAGITEPAVDDMVEHALALSEMWGISGYTAEDMRAIYALCAGE